MTVVAGQDHSGRFLCDKTLGCSPTRIIYDIVGWRAYTDVSAYSRIRTLEMSCDRARGALVSSSTQAAAHVVRNLWL